MSTISHTPPKITDAETDAAPELDHVPIWHIRPARVNDRVYHPIDPADPSIVALAESITERGILEPLILTSDCYILSGHRRFAAAKLACLAVLPCRIREDVSFEYDPDLFLRLLVEYNRQREKSIDEKIREEVICTDPEEAHAALVEHRRAKAVVSPKAMTLGKVKKRAEISTAKRPLLEAAQKMIEAQVEFWPLSVRQVHYRLLNAPPLIHASKPASLYQNDQQSYKALVDLLARARLEGLVSWESIGDETRPVTTWNVHKDIRPFLREHLDGFGNYWRDLLQSQPNHVELLAEKNTVYPIIKAVAETYCLPVTSGRGFCSLPPRYEIARRFRKSGKERLTLIFVSDHDPEGVTIATSCARMMRDDFGIDNIQAIKAALTAEQVKTFKLPRGAKAKAGSATRADFVSKFGEYVFELEALDPKALQGIVRQTVESVLDLGSFEHEVEEEKREAAELKVIRQRLASALGDVNGEGH